MISSDSSVYVSLMVVADFTLWILRTAVAIFGFLYILDFRVKKPVLWKFLVLGAVVLIPMVGLLIWFPA